MPPLHSRATRSLVKERNKIEGPKSLHRGLHYQQNMEAAKTYKTNPRAPRKDPAELLVHHQKINAQLQDIYSRTAALHKENATMEERIEESWRQFERMGGKRPAHANTAGQHREDSRNVLCVSAGAVAYADRLAQVSQQKKELRSNASWEYHTRGEAVDYGRTGSALHAMKDKRIELFQRRQLRRAHLLRRVGDPTPLTQSGAYDNATGTLRVFNKTIREVRRGVAHEEKIGAVKDRRPGSRSQWSVRDVGNVNRPESQLVQYTTEQELGGGARRRQQSKNMRRRAKRS